METRRSNQFYHLKSVFTGYPRFRTAFVQPAINAVPTHYSLVIRYCSSNFISYLLTYTYEDEYEYLYTHICTLLIYEFLLSFKGQFINARQSPNCWFVVMDTYGFLAINWAEVN